MPKDNPPKRKHRPTMTDVARLAGVSQSTVSMVLNNTAGARLSPQTRSRVAEAALHLGYRLTRRSLPSDDGPQRRQLIACLIDALSIHPETIAGVEGASDCAWENACMLCLLLTRDDAGLEAAQISALQACPALLGVIYASGHTRECSLPLPLVGIPTVLLNCHDEHLKLPTVLPAEISGGHAATEHLIAAGHRRIGLINGPQRLEAARDRLKGYRRALASADLPFDADLVRDGEWLPQTGYDAACDLMRRSAPPTALFVAHDTMAVGTLAALRGLGMRVPQDVAVIGYSDLEIARQTDPPLTTLALPHYEMGRTAVEALLNLAQADRHGHRLIKVEGSVVERGSVTTPGAPARG